MARKRKRKKTNSKTGNIIFGVLVFVIVVGGALFLFFQTEGGTTAATNALGSIITPIQEGVTRATAGIRNAITGVGRYREMSLQNQEYSRKIQELELEISTLEEAAKENERLLTLLDAYEHLEDEDPVYARVIGKDPGVWFDMFTINKGTNDDISVGNAVMTGDGLAGRIVEVGSNYAKVQSITDSRSSVACLIERTRDNGTMRGTADTASQARECTMHYLPSLNDIVPGDRVITSSTDRVYPKGLNVGVVSAVSRESGVSDQYIIVTPSVDFLHIEEVLVLRKEVESESSALSALPTSSPKPMPTSNPTATAASSSSQSSGQDENEPWSRPTVMPDEQENVPNNAPKTQSTAVPDYQVPEDEWAGD